MELDRKYLETRIKSLNFKIKQINEIVCDIIESHQMLIKLEHSQTEVISSQFHMFIDFFFFHLLESFLKNKKTNSRIFFRLSTINREGAKIYALLWFICFKQLDPEITSRIFLHKDYDLFWYHYTDWLEKNILKANSTDEQSMISSYFENRLSSILEINTKEWLSIDELSVYTSIAVGTLYNYVSNGDIPHVKKGGLKFNRKDVDKWLKSMGYDPEDIKKQMKSEGLL